MASKVQLKTREKGTGSIYKDGKRFYLKTRVGGRIKTKMLRNDNDAPCTSMDDALVAADKLRPMLLADSREELALHMAYARKLKKKADMSLASAWNQYLKLNNRPDSGANTLEWYKQIFDMFLLWINDNHPTITLVSSVSQDIAGEYFTYLWENGISGKTYNSYLQVIKMIFKYLGESAGLDINPCHEIMTKTVETSSRKEFTEEQVQQIFKSFDTGFFYESTMEQLGPGRKRIQKKVIREFLPMYQDEMKVLLNLCCWTACRGQDGCSMSWDCIDLARNTITYIPQKGARRSNNKPVTLPLHPDLREALLEALKWRSKNTPGENYILPSIARRFKYNHSGVQKDVMRIIHYATGLAVTDKNPKGRRKLAANVYSLHSFRHSFISFCANAGVPESVVADVVGHDNPIMTRHYTHINEKAKREAIAALPRISGVSKEESLLERVTQLAAGVSEEKLKEILKQFEA